MLRLPDRATALALPQTPAMLARTRAIVCEDPASVALAARIERIAPSDVPVLIIGETGTGKELVARQLHELSQRASGPFVAFNAGAMSEALAESELFGHERGAFTGAHTTKPGWFQAADGGTLFLDEIGDLPLAVQVKLLRALQEGEVTKVGSRTPTRVDVRVVSATNVDLLAAIRARRFREDLFYRLNVASLAIRPLRERPRDILPLARHFIARYAVKLRLSDVQIGASAAELMLNHAWPGNVRELQNAIHNALLLCNGSELVASDFDLSRNPQADDGAVDLSGLESVLSSLLDRGVPNLLEHVEKTLLSTAFRRADGNQLETGRLLGLGRNVIRARLIEHALIEGSIRGRHAKQTRALPARTATRTLRIGYQKLGLLMLARAHGALERNLAAEKIALEWCEYPSGIQIVEALSNGWLSAGGVGDCPAVLSLAQRVPIVYLAAEPPAPRGTALVVPKHSDIRGVADLRGRRVAVNRAAQAHYLLLRALDEAGVEQHEVEICFCAPEQAFASFRAGELDAWSIWDPWLSSARLELAARVLRDSTGLLQNSTYYVARREFADEHPSVIAEFLSQLNAVAAWVRSDPIRAAEQAGPQVGISPRALLSSLSRELDAQPLSEQCIASQQELADRLLHLQLLTRPVCVADAQWQPA
jgi:aliphatic sulfonates family ABC transporter substrate-binding protein